MGKMQIIIEGESVEWKLPRENILLKEVIEEAETFLLTLGKVPIALTIDGHILSQEELDEREKKPVTGEETLEFGVMGVGQREKG